MDEWLLVSVTVDDREVETAESVLFDAGAASVTLRDAGDAPVHEPAPGAQPLWPQTTVEGLFSETAGRGAIIDAIVGAGLVDAPTAVTFATLDDQDWERAWMDQYRPMRFGRSLWICPSHCEPDPEWPLVIRLDPGLAFGSGTHPTTALCLEWIDGRDVEGADVIDYGCGSGVLAIACALKGAASARAVDHDEQAVFSTLENARRNGVEASVQACLPEDFRRLDEAQRSADLVLANILAGPLITLADELAACLRPGGQLVLSGILPEQADAVVAAYAGLGEPHDRSIRDGWVRLVFNGPDSALNPR